MDTGFKWFWSVIIACFLAITVLSYLQYTHIHETEITIVTITHVGCVGGGKFTVLNGDIEFYGHLKQFRSGRTYWIRYKYHFYNWAWSGNKILEWRVVNE